MYRRNRVNNKPKSPHQPSQPPPDRQFIEKQITSRQNAEKKRPSKADKTEKLYMKANEVDDHWQPSFGAVIKMLLSMRIASALWGVINDCDEVYNYWEPLHLFLYGEGFQTWEYSPTYAIRSYFYIYLHYIPASLFASIFGDGKIVVFTLTRLVLGVFCLFGEYYAFTGICKRINIPAGRFFLIITIFSPGMFVASTAFLPSSFAMTCTAYMLGAYLHEHWSIAIFFVALPTIVGWPFVAVLGMPIVIDMLIVRPRRLLFFTWSLVYGFGIGFVTLQFDTYYFGKTVFAPLNIFMYNVIGGPGPELYGTAPFTYYLKNFVLNWNTAMFVAVTVLPYSYKCYLKHAKPPADLVYKWGMPKSLDYMRKYAPVFLLIFTCGTWLAIFFLQPHKEERFLFPAFPLVAFCAAVALDAYMRLATDEEDKTWRSILAYFLLAVFTVMSVCRIYATYNNFGAHIEIYKELHDELASHESLDRFHNPIRVCTGKEWHRFPSSFFIPQNVTDVDGNSRRVEFRFLESDFRGLLPKPFVTGDSLVNITRHVPTEMNDRNLEETSRYVPLDSCDYVIDVDLDDTKRSPNYRNMPSKLKVITEMPILDQRQRPNILRSFYVPMISPMFSVWAPCTLYRRIID